MVVLELPTRSHIGPRGLVGPGMSTLPKNSWMELWAVMSLVALQATGSPAWSLTESQVQFMRRLTATRRFRLQHQLHPKHQMQLQHQVQRPDDHPFSPEIPSRQPYIEWSVRGAWSASGRLCLEERLGGCRGLNRGCHSLASLTDVGLDQAAKGPWNR